MSLLLFYCKYPANIYNLRCIRKLLTTNPEAIMKSSHNFANLLYVRMFHTETRKKSIASIFDKAFNKNKPKIPKTLQFSERKTIGYSMEQLYNVVADVEKYNEFVPWCSESQITKTSGNSFKCQMVVGFYPIKERYTSLVTVAKPHLVRSECTDGKLFNHLLTIWRFSPYTNDDQKCILDFWVTFEFKSSLHSNLAQLFFDEVVKKMVVAFTNRAAVLYGPSKH